VDQQTREQFFINALVTEHFVLQSARGSLVGEMVGRGSIYLGTLSSALIAFGFVAQAGVQLGPFVAAVLPALFILGELTFVALLRDSFQNVEFLRRMQKIRGHYRQLLPEAEEFFDPPGQDSELAAELATVGLHRGLGALLFTGASTVAAVNSVLGGAGLALLLASSVHLQQSAITVIAVLAAMLLFGGHLWYEHWRSTSTLALHARRPARGGS
jgi:MFS family permease